VYTIHKAESPSELEAVFRFRYDHCFRDFPAGYPWSRWSWATSWAGPSSWAWPTGPPTPAARPRRPG